MIYLNSFENSVKESKELNEFFILASEENNSKLIQETNKKYRIIKISSSKK